MKITNFKPKCEKKLITAKVKGFRLIHFLCLCFFPRHFVIGT
jgi:hypothetical protein